MQPRNRAWGRKHAKYSGIPYVQLCVMHAGIAVCDSCRYRFASKIFMPVSPKIHIRVDKKINISQQVHVVNNKIIWSARPYQAEEQGTGLNLLCFFFFLSSRRHRLELIDDEGHFYAFTDVGHKRDGVWTATGESWQKGVCIMQFNRSCPAGKAQARTHAED